MEKISVIVPIYNVEKYLNKCVDSIINQTYKNLEIILVDDGCTDSCADICENYAAKDNRITVIHKEYGGPSDARNAGLSIATGQYISFIDSDDYISCHMIETLYDNMLKSNADMVLCDFEYIDEHGNNIDNNRKKRPVETGVFSRNKMFENLCGNRAWYYILVWNKLYKKEIFDNLRFPIGMIHEDEFIAHHIIDNCEKIYSIGEVMYHYVQREQSIMGKGISIKTLDRVYALFNRFEFFYEKRLYDLADKTLTKAITDLFLVYDNVDIKDSNVRVEFKKIKKYYNKIFCNVMRMNLDIKRRILYILCFINIGFCRMCSKARRLSQNKEKGREYDTFDKHNSSHI